MPTPPSSKQLDRAAKFYAAARRATVDPSAFVEFCFTDSLGQPLRQAAIHRELQAFLTHHPRALVELPRDHGKSVQVCGRVVWELGRNPALRVKLVCATDALAAERCRFLRDAIADNPRVRLLFPDLRPAQPWAAEAFTVARPGAAIGPTVAALGVGTGSTGARAERERVKAAFRDNLMNLLEPDGRFWGLCTPWHGADLNAELKANPAYAHFRRAVGPKLESVWPEKWTRARLKARREEIGSASFARGYLLTPVAADDLVIRPEWVKTFADERPRVGYDAVVLSVDPAVSAKESADASALVVLGRRPTGEIDCLAAVALRVSTPRLVEVLADWDRTHAPDAILFESNAAFAGIRDLLKRHATFGPRVVGLTQTRSKLSRVAAFSVAVEAGRFRLRAGDDRQRELLAEMTTFPHAAHDDLLDAAATGTDHLLGKTAPRVWV
jgi:predicted phage terminase large subunit-like protein